MKQNKFVRVAIQEESDEEEEEKAHETFEVGKEDHNESAADVAKEVPKPSAPVIQEVDSKENPNWWKKSSETLNYDDFNVEQKKNNGVEDIDGSEFLK